MGTAILSGKWQWKHGFDSTIDLYTGVMDEPVIDLRDISKPELRIMNGVIGGGIRIDTGIIEGVATPTLLSPIDGGKDIWTSPLLESRHFIGITSTGTRDTHVATYWEIATDVGFTNKVFSSGHDTANLTTLDLNAFNIILSNDTDYYVRVRHLSRTMGVSHWSPVSLFHTRGMVLNHQVQKISESLDDDSLLGTALDISADMSTLVITSRRDNTVGGLRSGSASIYSKVNGEWVLKQKLYPSTPVENGEFGYSVSVSHNGGEILVSALQNDLSLILSGAIYVFTYDTSSDSWVETDTLKPNTTTTYSHFARSISTSYDGTTLAAGIMGAEAGGLNNTGGVYIFSKDVNGVWVVDSLLVPVTLVADSLFGNSVKLSGDGNTLVIGAHGDSALGTAHGTVYIFTRNPVTGVWSESQIITGTGISTGDRFGTRVNINAEATKILIGAPYVNNRTGRAYYYEKDINGVWVEIQFIDSPTQFPSGNFSYSSDISPDGQTLYIGDILGNPDMNIPASVIAYKLISGIWQEVSRIRSNDDDSPFTFCNQIKVSSDSATMYVGSVYALYGNKVTGSVYIFE